MTYIDHRRINKGIGVLKYSYRRKDQKFIYEKYIYQKQEVYTFTNQEADRMLYRSRDNDVRVIGGSVSTKTAFILEKKSS